MARSDAIGFFWQDIPTVKPPKAEKPKRTPPERTWERPDYLPGLEQARQFPVQLFTDHELVQACINRERLIYDIEVYPNYFLAAFTSIVSGKVVCFELSQTQALDRDKLQWVMENFTTVGFNSINFDLAITALALAGKSNALLKHATNQIIVEGMRPSDVLKQYKVKKLKVDHIDLMEVAPLQASLKIYGGRLHAPKMQDLPFAPEVFLSEDQICIVRWYCVNDLTNTAILHECLKEQIQLRETLGLEYGIDLRSKSDAQIAEAVIGDEVTKMNGLRAQKPVIAVGTCYRYNIPNFLQYESPLMQWALNVVRHANFVVSEDGNVGMPSELKELNLELAGGVYRMGIGGLHSSEKSICHIATESIVLRDIDVESFYPRIILNQGLYPMHLGPAFLRVYCQIVDRRISAKEGAKQLKELLKKDGLDKIVEVQYLKELETLGTISDSLKITINGSFGKLGSKYSILYAPDLLIQVTVTGQLSLLMLIERMELRGITVVSANTDGIVLKYDKSRTAEVDLIISQWEHDTQFKMESTYYSAVYSRDVNNYIAIKTDGTTKTKGAFSNPWADKKNPEKRLHKNPTNQICVEAVEGFLTKGVPILQTIRESRDIRKFVSIRTVKGGAVKDGQYLGKSIRWYYATEQGGEMVYASNGNKVPRSDGAFPLLELPEQFPGNIDYDRYEVDAYKILSDIGYQSPE